MRGASWHIRHGVSIGCGALTTKGGDELGQDEIAHVASPDLYVTAEMIHTESARQQTNSSSPKCVQDSSRAAQAFGACQIRLGLRQPARFDETTARGTPGKRAGRLEPGDWATQYFSIQPGKAPTKSDSTGSSMQKEPRSVISRASKS